MGLPLVLIDGHELIAVAWTLTVTFSAPKEKTSCTEVHPNSHFESEKFSKYNKPTGNFLAANG